MSYKISNDEAIQFLTQTGGCLCPDCVDDLRVQFSAESENEPERTNHREMLGQCYNAKDFYMELHREKGDLEYTEEEALNGLLRNVLDLQVAMRSGNSREILAEGIGVSNWADIIVWNFALFELYDIQDWVPVLQKIKSEEA